MKNEERLCQVRAEAKPRLDYADPQPEAHLYEQEPHKSRICRKMFGTLRFKQMPHAVFFMLFFFCITLSGTIGHTVFYIENHCVISEEGESAFFEMLWNALRLDVAIAGYVTIIPALLLIIAIWKRGHLLFRIWQTYTVIISFAIVLAIMANIGLYPYWGFPLDSTPLFYLLTSPADAAASVGSATLLLALVALLLFTAVFYFFIEKVTCPRKVFLNNDEKEKSTIIKREAKEGEDKAIFSKTWRKKLWLSIGMMVLTALLIIPIRGGLSVATNNVGSVYFSSNYRLNHCAVNPVFSFLYSVSHDEDFSSKYRFMDNEEAEKIFREMVYTEMRTEADSILLEKDVKNVVMVILESFSTYIMSEGGKVEGVTPTLDSLAKSGIYFTNLYANSFRTDRGLVAILSGYPAQPTSSLMKYPKKTNSLYGIARSLKTAGFNTKYVYGGDANFTNMRAYLHSIGFESIVAEEDYDMSIPRNKWGVDDNYLFDRGIKEILEGEKDGRRRFFVIQTSSSHEPFEVPMKKFSDKALNAFYFADHCLGEFISELKKRELWEETLLVVVSDHLGCYPQKIENFKLYRYQIPLVISGGVVKAPMRVETIGAQQDIPATLLALLGINHDEYLFSKDLFDSQSPHFAFFTVPDALGMVTEENAIIYDNEQGKVVLDEGIEKGRNLRKAQAYLQKIYDDIAKR